MIATEAVDVGRRLVWSIAHRFGRTDDERADLAQDGFEALVIAAHGFDAERGVSFVTYAQPRIFGAVLRAAHVLRRRGLTPSHDYQSRKRPREVASLDAETHDGTCMHDTLAEPPDAETLAIFRETFGKLTARERVALLRGEVTDDHRRAFGLPVDARVGRGRVFEYRGRTQTITAWSRETGISFITIYNRLVVKGWSTARAFETPVAKPQGGRGKKKAA